MNEGCLILLTGTIAPNSFNAYAGENGRKKINAAVVDECERLKQYENAITRYIIETPFKDIVFAENSGYPFPKSKYEELASKHNKRFEFLYRSLTEDEVFCMLQRGKSWGEADLIDYAMANSTLIKEHDVIYKCTGRAFLKNSKRLINKATTSEFVKSLGHKWVLTHFFKLNKDDYKKYLKSALPLINDYKRHSIERVWYDVINSTDMKAKVFRGYPQITGISASSNGVYDKKRWEYLLIDFYLMLGGKKFNPKQSK